MTDKPPFKITSIHVIMGVDESTGDEGAWGVKAGDTWIPLVAADESRLMFCLGAAKGIKEQTGKEFRVLKFSTREDVTDEVINHYQLLQDERELLSCPGETIRETLIAKGMDIVELRDRIGLDGFHLYGLLYGHTPIDEDLAKKLEAALGIDAQFWLNKELIYRERLKVLNEAKFPFKGFKRGD